MRSTELVMGVDGGATRTRVVIADGAGKVCGRGEAPGSNHHTVGVEGTRRHLAEAVALAWQAAGEAAQPVRAAFLGMAGVMTTAERQLIAEIAGELGLADGSSIEVDHDLRIAWAGGLAGRPGVVVIAGTGSACYGRNAAGGSWRAGGWEWLFDNQGGAYRVALAGLEAVSREYDGRGESTGLTPALVGAFGVGTAEELVAQLRLNRMDKAQLAGLAPVVLAVAEQGDAVAAGIAGRQANELALAAEAVSRRLGLSGEAQAVTYTGSLLLKNRYYRGLFTAAVERRLPLAGVVAPRLSPVLGAVVLALQAARWPVTETVLEQLAAGGT